ncbi:hypothetical protein HNY73_017125 [Argiope bruennichi]|uniref:Uncharacterized protein n=1 Tax=Argiope bruennichi TaxID=94029 RepID=A0A8T0EKL7_ARGBR|nr:hypothetical protein HNY73_017125 [Argiope bruennichi]
MHRSNEVSVLVTGTARLGMGPLSSLLFSFNLNIVLLCMFSVRYVDAIDERGVRAPLAYIVGKGFRVWVLATGGCFCERCRCIDRRGVRGSIRCRCIDRTGVRARRCRCIDRTEDVRGQVTDTVRSAWVDISPLLFLLFNIVFYVCFCERCRCIDRTRCRARIQEIQRFTDPKDWRHCPGKDNPANLISRGMSAAELRDSEFWWHGPDWLAQNEHSWPKSLELPKELNIENIENYELCKGAILTSTVVECPSEND